MIIELQPEALVKATTLVYLVPATAMVTGATAGWLWLGSDLGSMIGALAGFVVASLFIFLHGRREKPGKGPAISKVLSPGGIVHIDHGHKTHGFSQ